MGNKFVIIGAGSTHTPGIIGSLVEKADEIQLTELCLHDIMKEFIIWVSLVKFICQKEEMILRQAGLPI